MRNLIFAINITLDGCCDHAKLSANEEIHEYFAHLMRDVDVLVYGRKTYQLMVPFWPDTLAAASTPTEAAQALVGAANDSGGPDNVSCVVADLVNAESQ